MTTKSRLLAIVASLVWLSSPSLAADPPLPSDLDRIPRDAEMIVSVRVAKLWRSDLFKSYRDMVGKDPESMIEMFGFRPDDLDRITVAATGSDLLVVLTTIKPTDQKAVRKVIGPRDVELKFGTVKCYRNEETWTSVAFLDEHTSLMGSSHSVELYLKRGYKKDGPHVETLKLAATEDVVFAATNGEAGLKSFHKSLPEPFKKAAPRINATFALITLNLLSGDEKKKEPSKLLGKLVVRCDSKADAKADAIAVASLLDVGREQFESLKGTWEKEQFAGPLNDGLISAVKKLHAMEVGKFTFPTADGSEFVVNLTVRDSLDVGLVAVFGVFDAITRTVLSDGAPPKPDSNLEKLAKALLKYEKVHGHLPPPAIYAKDGKTPLLSWRVLILPDLGDDARKLHAQFKLDEPWDSEHNIRLVSKMPKLFASADDSASATTHFQVFTGSDTLFPGPNGRPLKDAFDGAENTILIAQGLRPVPWTKPEDLAYAAGKPVPLIGGDGHSLSGPHTQVAFADGKVRVFGVSHRTAANQRIQTLPNNAEVEGWGEDFDEPVLRAMITPAGGEKVALGAEFRKRATQPVRPPLPRP